MLCFVEIETGKFEAHDLDELGDWRLRHYVNRNDWCSFDEVRVVAKGTGPGYLAVDRGHGWRPKYDVIRRPQVGDAVSMTTNGDYWPDGFIKSVSANCRLIRTTTGSRYYRQGKTGVWLKNGTWSMVPGHITQYNREL